MMPARWSWGPGVIKDELVGPFQVENELKMNSEIYRLLLENTLFTQWCKKVITMLHRIH